MSLYEALVLVAMVGAGGFAWHLYRKDTTADPETREKQAAAGQSMFGRDRGNPDGKG